MRSISNSLLESKQTIVQEMTNNSLQELNRLQAIESVEEDNTELIGDNYFDDSYEEEQDNYSEDQDYYEEDTYIEEDEQYSYEEDTYIEEDEQEEQDSYTNTTLLDDALIDTMTDDDDMVDNEMTEDETIVAIDDDYADDDTDSYDEDDAYFDDMEYDEDQDEAADFSDSTSDEVDNTDISNTTSIEEDYLEDADDEQYDDEQYDYTDEFDDDYVDDESIELDDNCGTDFDTSNIVEEKIEESSVEEQYVVNCEDTISKTDNSFENFELEGETSSNDIDFEEPDNFEDFTESNEEYPEEIMSDIEIDADDQEEDERFDQNLLDSIPTIVEQKEEPQTQSLATSLPSESDETLRLREENERLKLQLAEAENARLKQQLAELQKQTVPAVEQPKLQPITMNKGVVRPTSKKAETTEQKVEITDKEREQRKRWAKYASMSTADLWKYVYRFMVMAGVKTTPVKPQILYNEFGSHNIKRLEASYIMKIKDGYTC